MFLYTAQIVVDINIEAKDEEEAIQTANDVREDVEEMLRGFYIKDVDTIDVHYRNLIKHKEV